MPQNLIAPVTEPQPPTPEQTSARRWVILALLFTITVVNFIDRQTLSVLAPVLRTVYHLSNEAYGRIVAALGFGMMCGEFPAGWIMDRFGARLGVSAAVLWWSAATATQAVTRSGVQLGLTRLWMGSGECGNYSGGMKTVTRFFAQEQRTIAVGVFNSGSMIGATLAPPLIVLLMQRYGFRAAFLLPAVLGACWVPLWLAAYPRTQASSLFTPSLRTRLRVLLGQSSAWAVMLCRFFVGPVIQFYWYWIPSYLYSVRHMSMSQIGFLAWIPFLLGDSGGVLGGWAVRALQRRGYSMYTTRRITMFGSSALCVVSLTVPRLHSASWALLAIGLAILAHNFLSANMYGAITDLFPPDTVGRATGLTGVAGGLSGLMFPLLTGALVDHISYRPVFLLIAFMPLTGTALLFLLGRRYREPADPAMAYL